MTTIPQAAITAAAAAMNEAHAKRGWNKPEPWWVSEVVTAALEAAAPVLAEEIAQRILAHMEGFGPHRPAGALEPVTAIGRDYRAWRRHFGIAARVAAGAFWTDEDKMRLAAEAIERGEFIGCNIPEVPGE